MSQSIEKTCSGCGQKLRFPKNVGGVVMACPNCGKRFGSDFKIGDVGQKRQGSVSQSIFELPTTMLDRVLNYLRLK